MSHIDEIFCRNQIFKDVDSSELKKIHALSGDCSQADLGLSVDDLNTLIKEVNVIFHSAATVRFDERLDIAIGINVIGAREIVKLAHKVENLEVRWDFLVHSRAKRVCRVVDVLIAPIYINIRIRPNRLFVCFFSTPRLAFFYRK